MAEGSSTLSSMNIVAQADKLTKRYGTATVVDNLSFLIPEGSVVGLIGPNGAGKTTTMKMLLGLVSPSAGSMELLGVSVGGSKWGTVLKRVGSMIEDPPIYDRMTARQNLRYQSLAVTGRVDDGQIEEILRLVDLADRADDRPRAYSLGMRQRLGIGISLMGNPELVILDEPANGLDPAGIIDIRNLLRRLPESGTTVLVSSHQLAEVQQACDQLVILAQGKLVTEGTVDEILGAGTSHHFRVSVDGTMVELAMSTCRDHGFGVEVVGPDSFLVSPPDEVDGRAINQMLFDAGLVLSEITKPRASLEDAFLDLVSSPSSLLPAAPASSPTESNPS